MADSNSEPCRCPCGFFGRSETGGLCSKCYREHQQKKGAEAAPEKNPAASSVSADVFSKAVAQVALPTPSSNVSSSSSLPISEADSEASQSANADETAKTQTEEASSSNGTKRSRVDSQSALSTSEDNKKKREEEGESSVDPDRPVQKNKKKCFKCNCKLQPAIREIGKCKCDYIFCQLHRLPEQHDCVYDHKEKGRQEARAKMVSPKKHMGTSLKRIDSDS